MDINGMNIYCVICYVAICTNIRGT